MDGIELELIPTKRNRSDVFKQIQSMNDDKINIPQKKCCYHNFQLIVIIFIQIASIWSLLNQFYSDQFSQVVEWIIVVLINLFCIFASYFVSNIKRHLDNLRNISDLNIDYERIRNSTVELNFSIQCYHYRESLNSRSKSSQKIVTHRADKTIKLSKCYDFSGHIQDNILNSFSNPYVFIDYEAGFEFLEQVQQIILDNMEKDFKQKNTRDDYQNYKKTFNFTDCEEKSRTGYVLKGNWSSFKYILALSSILMLSWPVSMIMEIFFIERYKIRIVKKIKLQQDQQGYQNINY